MLNPSINNSYDIGSSGLLWRAGYFNTLQTTSLFVGGSSVSSNADTLDSQHGSYYRNVANITGNLVRSVNSATGALTIVGTSGVSVATYGTTISVGLSGGCVMPIRNVSGNFTVYDTDYTLISYGIATTGSLPSAVGRLGKMFIVKSQNTNSVTLAAVSGQTIEGVSTLPIDYPYAVTIQSNGSNWLLVSSYWPPS